VGEPLGFLPNGTPLGIFYSQEIVTGVEWIQVRDILGREAWVPKAVQFIRS
jgi:SH3-like domain-containing protein